MLKTVTASVAALAAMGFASTAMADPQEAVIGVDINVLEHFSIWANASDLTLTIDPANDPSHSNSGAVDTLLNYVSNVQTDIKVAVTGDLPAPIPDTGGPLPNTDVEISFYVYNDTAANALADMRDINGPTNHKGVWTDGTMGHEVSFGEDLAAANGGMQTPVAFAAQSAQGLPAADIHELTATFTITEANVPIS